MKKTPENSHPQASQKYLTTQEAAEYLGISPKTLEYRRYNGTGPAYTRRSGKLIRYTYENLDAWMEAGLHPS